MWRGAFVLALLLWAAAASADYNRGGFTAAQTRFGALQIVDGNFEQRLLLNGAELGISNHRLEIDGVWAVEGGAQDWVVITSYHGGNMCGGFEHMAVMLSAAGAVRTQAFGICQGAPIDIRITPDAMELDISDPAPRIAYQTFRFDGVQLTQQPVAEATAPAAGAGSDVTRWLQKHPQALTQDPAEQARFAQIMTPAQMDDLNRRMSGPGATEQRGNWVVGRACQAHQCNVSSAIWALRIADGRAIAIFFDDVGSESGAPDSQTFGFGPNDWQDPELRAFLEETLP